MRSSRSWWALAFTVLVNTVLVPAAFRPGAALAAPEAPVAPRSRLPYTAGSDVWVDAEGAPSAPAPGVAPGAIRRVRVVVFRPKGDDLTWPTLTSLYVDGGVLAASPKVEFSVLAPPREQGAVPDPSANAYETNVYATRTTGELAVLGFIRNLATQHLLAYAVVITGRLNNVQAVAQARSIVDELALQAKVLRQGAPLPPGCVATGPTARVTGVRVQQLMQNIEQSRIASNRVKEMARVVVPQASAVTLSNWRTPAPMTDAQFFEFYLQEAAKLGWGQPLSRDETRAGYPTLLFQRTNPDAMIMIRAQPAPLVQPTTVGAAAPRPGTLIYVLVMEGKIDPSGLRPK